MRWARRDTFVRRSKIAHEGRVVEAMWEDNLSALVVAQLGDGSFEARITRADGIVRLRRPTAVRLLRVLAALDLIPAELTEDEPEPDGARGDAPLVAVTVVDVAETARRLFGGKGPAEFIAGRPLPEHDYRLKAKTPTGGEVSFHRGATADHVAEYWRREGWLPGVAPC